jgi:hypothetical protein
MRMGVGSRVRSYVLSLRLYVSSQRTPNFSPPLSSAPLPLARPQRIGTPEEDALRRDITINTLFYNVHTRLIEDHTHLGLSDLAHKLVRTPLDPLQTFRDDPLRVLRCVRFASRFGYELVDEVKMAVTNEEILVSCPWVGRRCGLTRREGSTADADLA